MTELEKWENCYKERNLIKDFLNYAAMKHQAKLRQHMGYSEDDFGWEFRSADEDEILDEYFQIDPKKLDEERRALLEKARNMEASK